jgi:hypothetical protein
MKENANDQLSKICRRAALAIVAIGIAAASTLNAKANASKAANTPEKVVAHVELSGRPVTRMLLVKNKGKEYLLLGLDSPSGVALLDVSKPNQAHTIDIAAGAAGTTVTELKIVADTLRIFGASEAEGSSEPKEIHSLSGVTAFLSDKTHGLIYATNGDGLWIVKTPQRADADESYVDPDQIYQGGG